MGYFNTYIIYPILEKTLERDVRSKYKIILDHFKLPFEERKKIIKKKLITQLEFAGECVPYYREVFKKLNFNPQKINKDIKYLKELPILTKDIIIKHGNRMLNQSLNKNSFIECKTGGSTGASMFVYYTQAAADWSSATTMVSLEWAGKKRTMKEVHLATHFPEDLTFYGKFKENMKCLAMNRRNIFTNSFEDEDMEIMWKKIKNIKPYLIQGHPSTLYALSCFLERKQYNAKNEFEVFESTGEVLDKKKRDKIKDILGCRIVNRYGNAEFGIVAYETKNSDEKLKVIDYIAYPESEKIDSDIGNEMIITGLTNDAMPLFRYRTGDLGELEEDNDGYYYYNIQGRVHDLIKIGDKIYPTHYIQDLLDRIGGIDEFQIKQENNKIIFRIVASKNVKLEYIKQKISSWFGEKVSIEFTNFNGLIRKGWRGKFRYLV